MKIAAPVLILFELLIYIEFLLCLAHARKHGLGGIVKLLSAVLLGVAWEVASILQWPPFHFGHFLISVSGLPLCIGIAWGSILFSVAEFSDATSLPHWARPLLEGLLVLNVDLALDPLAVRLGFWHWGRPLTAQYFGVPYGALLSLFGMVLFFSSAQRTAAHRRGLYDTWLAGPFGILAGVIALVAINAFMVYFLPTYYHVLPAVLAPIIALSFMVSLQPALHQRPEALVAFLVPFLTLLYVIIAGLLNGVILEPLDLLAITLAMLGIIIVLHWFTIRHLFRRRVPGIR
ncbi:MAG: carotenoid biosynthesis protein [Bacteroidota bacterium]